MSLPYKRVGKPIIDKLEKGAGNMNRAIDNSNLREAIKERIAFLFKGGAALDDLYFLGLEYVYPPSF